MAKFFTSCKHVKHTRRATCSVTHSETVWLRNRSSSSLSASGEPQVALGSFPQVFNSVSSPQQKSKTSIGYTSVLCRNTATLCHSWFDLCSTSPFFLPTPFARQGKSPTPQKCHSPLTHHPLSLPTWHVTPHRCVTLSMVCPSSDLSPPTTHRCVTCMDCRGSRSTSPLVRVTGENQLQTSRKGQKGPPTSPDWLVDFLLIFAKITNTQPFFKLVNQANTDSENWG